jgi:hypothetical protein
VKRVLCMAPTARRHTAVSYLAIAVSFGVVAGCAPLMHPKLTRETRDIYCAPREDNFNVPRAEYLPRLAAEGEAGRDVLLYLAGSSGHVQLCAIEFLVAMQDPRVVPRLRKLVTSPTLAESDRAVYVHDLGLMKDRESLDVVLDLMKKGGREMTQSGVIFLGLVDDERARAELRARAVNAPDWLVPHVITALGASRDRLAVPILRDYASRMSAEGYWSIAVALVRIGTPEAIDEAERLIPMIPDDFKPTTLYQIEAVLSAQRAEATSPLEQQRIDGIIEAFRALFKKR